MDKWISHIPIKVLRPYLKGILPNLSPYLVLTADSDTQQAQGRNIEVTEILMRKPSVNASAQISKRVLELLGNLGGECHGIVGDLSSSNIAMAWELDRIVKFAVPLLNRKVDIYLDTILPKIIELTKTTVNTETRTAAIEFLHAIVVYIIGKTNEQQEKLSFGTIFRKLIPEMLRLASDIQQVPRSIFEPLCKQLVHWLATSVKQEKEEVSALLDSLLEGAADKSNATLRELCAICIGEYFDWNVRHIGKSEIVNNPQTVKSLIRKIQSFAIHPDPFKQLASILCFEKLMKILRNEPLLVDFYIMDITVTLLNALRLAEQSICQNVAKHLIEIIIKIITQFHAQLKVANPKRSGIKTYEEFTHKLFEKINATEELSRMAAQDIWSAACGSASANLWLKEEREKQSQPNSSRQPIIFEEIDHIKYTTADAAIYLKGEKINAEMFSAQTQCLVWLIKNKYIIWSEVDEALGSKKITRNYLKNVKSFLNYILHEAEKTAKEMRNQIIKHQIIGFAYLLELWTVMDQGSFCRMVNESLEMTWEQFTEMLLLAAIDPACMDLEQCATDKVLQNKLNLLISTVLNLIVSLKIFLIKLSDFFGLIKAYLFFL